MTNLSEQSHFVGSLALVERPSSRCNYCGTDSGRRSPFVGGESRVLFQSENQDLSLHCSSLHPDRNGLQLLRKNSAPELGSGLYLKQMAADRSSMHSQEYYPVEITLSGQATEESSFYRDKRPPLTRSASYYGPSVGGVGASTGDQGQTRQATTPTPAPLPHPPPPTLPPPPPPPPPPPHSVLELSRLYRETLGSKMIPDVQHFGSGPLSPGLYAVQTTLPCYPTEALTRQAYNGLPQHAATNSAVDPASQVMDGTLSRPYGAVASQRLPYDPNYDPTSAIVAATAAGITSGLPAHHPSATDPKKMVDPSFLAFLRAEGLAESTITLLLQHGFDSSGMLGMMEDHDIRSVAPNLAQARVLSRVVLTCKSSGVALRGRSNSFSHANYMQPQGLSMDASLMQQPHNAIQNVSPRMGEFLGRRPSSAPSQHLLETTYSGARPIGAGAYPVSPDYNQGRPLSLYNAQAGLGMCAFGPQAQPGIPGAAPKTFSGSYSPMELMKRPANLPPASPLTALSPLHSPQLLRKGINAVPDSTMVPVSSTSALHTQNFINSKVAGRRTGPPVIVSTMVTTPDTSKVHLQLILAVISFIFNCLTLFSQTIRLVLMLILGIKAHLAAV